MINAFEPELELHKRERLPDALRILLEDFPRNLWESNERFDGLVRFWLDRHLMFRRLMDALKEQTELVLDKDLETQAYRHRMSRYGSMFVNELHMHHQIEDFQYFPLLQAHDERLKQGFEILDSDHHAISSQLDKFAVTANSVLQQTDEQKLFEQSAAFAKILNNTHYLLDRHLTDEEELVVPIILKYGHDLAG